jgi:small GTP-binding protein
MENKMTTIQKKICLLGDFGVGKTSLVQRFVEGRFDDKYLSTVGVKISRKTLVRSYGEMNMLIWDLAGSNGFESSSSNSYMQGATGALIVCDLTRRDTLIACENYARQVRTMNPGIQLACVGNKVDLTKEREVFVPDLLATLSVFGERTFFLTSAKTGERVEDAFIYLAEKIEGGM